MNRIRRMCTTENRVKAAVILLILAVASGGSYVYAKYFSEAAQKGVVIASGVYFSANYASEVKADSGEEEYFESIVKSDYVGSNYDFNFEVRNYENNLLFNESGVIINYSLSFWLGAEPDAGATYYVKTEGVAGNARLLGVGKENAVTIKSQSIDGGAASANKYAISVIVPEDATHKAVPIYVEVETAEGAIINKTLRGKMVMYNVAAPENYIESQEFIVPEEVSGGDAEKFARIEKISMLTYEIRTVGEVATDEVTESLKLSWNPQLLEIDLFDEAYLIWQQNEAAEDGTTPQTPYTDDKGWYYITLDVMPYSAQTVGFFRGEKYAEQVTDMTSLNGAIIAEKYVAD